MNIEHHINITGTQQFGFTEGGKGYFRDAWLALFFPMKCEMANFSSRIMISIVAVNRDFQNVLFYFPWNVIYNPPLPPSLLSQAT